MNQELDRSINNLMGTFNTINMDSDWTIMDQNICIDTSFNRIGINTLDPSHSIHVLNGNICTDSSLIAQDIYCDTLRITNGIFLKDNITGDLSYGNIEISGTQLVWVAGGY
jgi:hypothetical protein